MPDYVALARTYDHLVEAIDTEIAAIDACPHCDGNGPTEMARKYALRWVRALIDPATPEPVEGTRSVPDYVALIEARADVVHALIEFLEALHESDGASVSQRGDDLEDAVERAVEEWRRSPHGDASRPRPVE